MSIKKCGLCCFLPKKEASPNAHHEDNKTTARTLCCIDTLSLTDVYSKSASILVYYSFIVKKLAIFFLRNNIVNALTHYVLSIQNPLILIGIATKLGILKIKSKGK